MPGEPFGPPGIVYISGGAIQFSYDKSTGMSKTKYNSETTITQAKCTKKWDKICELCQGRLPQTKYIPRLLNFYF